MSDEMPSDFGSARVRFGLEAQGNLAKVRDMRAKGECFEVIARRIGWTADAVATHWAWHLEADVARLTADRDAAEAVRDSHARRLEHLLAEVGRLRAGWEAAAGERDALRDEVEDYRAKDGARTVRVDADARLRADLANQTARAREATGQLYHYRRAVAAMMSACGLPGAGDACRAVLAIGRAATEGREVDVWPALRSPDADPGGVALVLLDLDGNRSWATANYWRQADENGGSPWVGEWHPDAKVLGWLPLPPVPTDPQGGIDAHT